MRTEWEESAAAGTYTPLSESELDAMFEATCRYGSGNCWTGTSGTLAAMIRKLLRERRHLIEAMK